MAARNKPYDQFGPYVLFKKLEADALGDLWRAARIDAGRLGPTVALRRLSGGSREAFAASVQTASQILPQISGTSFVRDQHAGVIDGVPFLSWEYAGGRSLRHIIDRARGGKDAEARPLPIDQAIVIAEKVALSLATLGEMRDGSGARLCHGGLVPQLIWISDDGEIRVAGQQLGPAMIASARDTKVAADIGRYFSPEYRASGQPQKNTDVYSMGAILFLLVTGQEPPDAATASAFVAAVRAGKTTSGEPIPDDLRVILDKSFNLDPSMRYPSMAEMKQALSALANGGRYSATTFNLAFYLSGLLKKEMETEAVEREKESKVNVASYADTPKPAAAAPASVATAAEPAVLSVLEKRKSRLPLAIAAVVFIAAAGAGAYVMWIRNAAAPATQPVAAAQVIPPAVTPPVSEPIVATPDAAAEDAATAAMTPEEAEAARKRAFEDAVRQKLQAEMMKLQADFLDDLKQKQPKNAPVAAPPPAASTPAEERPVMTAAELDAQRLAARQEQLAPQRTPAPAPAPAVTTQTAAAAPQQTANAATAAVPPPPLPKPAAVREGDVIDVASLDSVPRPLRPIRVSYPPIARRQKISATIILTAFIDERGEVTDVRVLRGDARFGFNDAATRAVRATRYSPPVKEGKRVRTWLPQTIEFVPD